MITLTVYTLGVVVFGFVYNSDSRFVIPGLPHLLTNGAAALFWPLIGCYDLYNKVVSR